MDQETFDIIARVIAVATVISTVTPTPTDNVVLGALRQLLNIFAGQVGQAKPEKKPPLPRRKKGPRRR